MCWAFDVSIAILTPFTRDQTRPLNTRVGRTSRTPRTGLEGDGDDARARPGHLKTGRQRAAPPLLRAPYAHSLYRGRTSEVVGT